MSKRDDDLIQGRQSGTPEAPAPAAPPTQGAIRARQRSRALVMALLLGAFVVLIFAISIVKMTPGAGG
jgi:hypothetical protein